MKALKRIGIFLLVLLVLTVGFLVAAPVLFKDKIIANVKSSVNNNLEAEVDFADANISFLSSFPDISVVVDDFAVVGVDTFAGLPLISGRQATVDLGFWSVVAGDGVYQIDGVTLEEPNVNLRVLSPELANYLIVADTGEDAGAAPSETAGSARFSLEEFAVHDGTFVYDDRTTETYLRMTGLDVTGEGDFTSSLFDLDLEADAETLTLRQSGVNYLSDARATVDGTVGVDLNQNKYTFRENVIRLNELDLTLDGSLALADNDDIVFDLGYRAPANNFRQLWSMVPAVYTEGYEQVQTNGTFTLTGTVKGPFNAEREVYPALTLASEISNGSVQYPGRPVGISGIDAQLSVNSPGPDLDGLVVDVPRFDFDLGGDPFRGRFRLSNPLSDPSVDARVKGTLDLRKWSQAVPLEGVRELAGLIVADVTMDRVRQSVLDADRYADLNLGGDLRISNLVYDTEDLPPVRIAQASADFSPQAVTVDQFNATLGRSDVSASGRIDNVLAYFSPKQTMRGQLTLRSNFFDADEWLAEDDAAPTTSLSPAELSTAATPTETAVFDRFDFDVDADIRRLNYAGYRPEDVRVTGNIKPNRLEIANGSVELGESNLSASGLINNLFDYALDDGVLTGDISLRSGFLNLADFMGEDTAPASSPTSATPAAEASSVIPVPRNINLRLDVLADRIQYTDVLLNNLDGELLLQNGQAVIQNGSAGLLGGRMNFAGAYDTSEPGDPGFRFQYDLKSLDFGQAFAVLSSFASLAPVGKYLSGQFNSEMVVEGKLGPDLFPKLNSLDASGLIATAEATISGFKPLQTIGRALNVEALRGSTTLRDIMTVFTIQDGRVAVEPFDLRLAGTRMVVSGTHGLNSDMDYRIQAAIPRELIEGNIVTGSALSALDKLAGQAGRLGLNLSPGDTLNLSIGLTGSLTDPRVGFDLLGSSGGGGGSVQDAVVADVKEQINAEIDTRREEVADRVSEERDRLTETAETRARAVQDSLQRVAAARAEALRQQAADRLGGILGNPSDSTRRDSTRKDSTAVVVPPAVKDRVDEVKDRIRDFNPFKKKTGGGGN